MKLVKYSLFLLCLAFSHVLVAHVGEHSHHTAPTYTIKGKKVQGHFMMMRDGIVSIKQKTGKIVSAPLLDFSLSDQSVLSAKINHLKEINTNTQSQIPLINSFKPGFYFLIALSLLLLYLFFQKKLNSTLALCSAIVLFYACKTDIAEPQTTTPTTTAGLSKTNPTFIETVFSAFKSEVKTRFDDTYFYVESEGIPTSHNMMVGITSWQQQVPIPQGYTGSNAWAIPLQPVFATTLLSLKTNFMKGAVAIAPNGIPIFNPLNNRGEDAFVIGELDQWGGHCGRADDYHYHIAPLHFEATSGNNPIAMALDGFPIYGTKEPDGTALKTLDEYHGHSYNNSYHYHASTKYPYFIAAMRGKVNLDPTLNAPENQIIPQAKATALRPALTPLTGAAITNFKSTGTNAYSLEYTKTSKKAFVNYSWDTKGLYTFTFIDADGKSTSSQYTKK